MRYSIIIPIFNEERTLLRLLKKLESIESKNEIIIVDDGSNDRTDEILKNQCDYIVIKNKKNLGKGSSIRNGLKLASKDNIIIIDGDLEIDLDEIPKLTSAFEENKYDVIIGRRWNNNKKIGFQINRIGNFIINFIFNSLYKTNFNDVLCCVRVIKKKSLLSFNLRSKGFDIEIETIINIVKKGLKYKEVELSYNRRMVQDGKKIKLSDTWIILWKMISLRFKA